LLKGNVVVGWLDVRNKKFYTRFDIYSGSPELKDLIIRYAISWLIWASG
jgi:hypothetical protein